MAAYFKDMPVDRVNTISASGSRVLGMEHDDASPVSNDDKHEHSRQDSTSTMPPATCQEGKGPGMSPPAPQCHGPLTYDDLELLVHHQAILLDTIQPCHVRLGPRVSSTALRLVRASEFFFGLAQQPSLRLLCRSATNCNHFFHDAVARIIIQFPPSPHPPPPPSPFFCTNTLILEESQFASIEHPPQQGCVCVCVCVCV